jgi:L-fucono-1,5-lactonase
MRVDSHQHFWRYDSVRDGWITDEMAVLKRDFLPSDLLPELSVNGINACIAVQADQSENETRFLLDLADKHREIAGVVGWVNLLDPRVEERLGYFSQFRKLRGFRHVVQAEPDGRFLLRKHFLRGIGMLARFGFTYDILIYERHLAVANEFVQHFPEQKFVIDHIAKPQIKNRSLDNWARGIRSIAKHPNAWCKVSGLVTEADWKRWTADDIRPYLDGVFEAFGVDRLMYGSDWPVCLLAANYGRVKSLLEDYTQHFSATDKNKIFGGNAVRFYGLAA